MPAKVKVSDERIKSIRDLVVRFSSYGAESGPQASGPALSLLILHAIDEDAGRTDPRQVAIGIMKNMRQAMQTLRDELDGHDSVGEYA